MNIGPVRRSTPEGKPFLTAGGLHLAGRKAAALAKNHAQILFHGALVALMVLIYYFAQNTVALYVDGAAICTADTFSRTVEELLEEKGIELHPRDRVTPERHTLLQRCERIDIEKAFEVTVIDGEKSSVIFTPAVPVMELLIAEGFKLGPYDRIEPAGLDEVCEGLVIEVVRVQKEYQLQRSKIPFAEVSEKNPLLDRGMSRVKREGKAGLQEELIEVTMEKGVEVERRTVGTALLKEPQAKVVEHGDNTILEREGRVMEFDRILFATITAYCPGTPGSGCPLDRQGRSACTGSYNNGRTATGKKAVQGEGTLKSPRIVAVDPRVIPLGSLLYIESVPGVGKIGFARAEDVGGAIKGQKIDLLFNRHRDVIKFGLRRGVKVYLLK